VDDDEMSAVAMLRRAWNEEVAGGLVEDDGFEASFAAWWSAERDTRTFFVVEADGVAVGMANVKRYERMPSAGHASSHWGYVGNVFVVAEHRNAGVGRALMDEVIAWAWAERMDHLRLAPSPLSGTFYERLGFTAGAVVELDPPPDS